MVMFTCLTYCTNWNPSSSVGECWAVNIITHSSLEHPVCEIVQSYPSAVTTDTTSIGYVAEEKIPQATGYRYL